MAVEVFIGHEDVHEHFSHEGCAVIAGIIFHDDALELAQTLLDVGVLFVVLFLDAVEGFLWQSTLQKGFDVGMNVGVLEGHVSLHLLCVLVVEAQNQHSEAITA